MPRPPANLDKLSAIAALCQQAVQEQRDRERQLGYGLDDYTEGRIVGGANLARKILRVVSGEPVSVGPVRNRQSLVG